MKRFFIIASFIMIHSIHGYVPYKQVEVTFDAKVKTYLANMKDKIVMLRDGTPLLYALNRYAVVSLNKVEKLGREIQNIKLPETGISADQIRTTALMQLVVPIIDKFKKDIMNLITTLEISKKYWEVQRENKASSFFAPYLQRFTGRMNKKLNDKINVLDADLDRQFTDLGSLTLHLDRFDENQNPDEHFGWLQELCTIIINAYPHAKLQPNEATFEQVTKMVILASKCVMHYPLAIRAQIKPYLMPNNFNQHLIQWSFILAALGSGARYAYEEKDILKVRAEQAGESVKTFGLEQYGRIKEAFLGNVEKEKELQKKYKEILDNLHSALTVANVNEEVKQNVEVNRDKEEEESKEEKKEIVNDELAIPVVSHAVALTKIPQERRVQFDPPHIDANAKEISAPYLDDIVIPMLFDLANLEVREASASTKDFSEKLKQVNTSVAKNLGFQDLSNAFWKIVGNETVNSPKPQNQQKEQLIQDVIQEAGIPTQKISTVVDTVFKFPSPFWLWWQVEKWTFLKQSRFFLAILTSIPVYLVLSESGKGLYTLYKKVRGVPVYDGIREALVDTAMLLNIYGDAHPSAMAIDDYGRLIYLIGRLKDPQMIKHVPYEYRTSFASNVQFLESNTLSAAEKLRMIDLMYKRYPFLVNDPRYTAKAA